MPSPLPPNTSSSPVSNELVQALTHQADEVQGLAQSYGLPLCRALWVGVKAVAYQDYPVENLDSYTWTEVLPRPMVETISPVEMAKRFTGNVGLSEDGYLVLGVSRRYAYPELRTGLLYLVDPVLDGVTGLPTDGTQCELVEVMDQDLTRYSLVLRARADNRTREGQAQFNW